MSFISGTKRSLVLFVAAAICLTAVTVFAQSSSLSRGHGWVRSHDFTIMAAVGEEADYQQTDYIPEVYRDMGTSYFLPWTFNPIHTFLYRNQRVNLPWFELVYLDYDASEPLSATQMQYSQFYYNNYSGCGGFFIMDEPNRQQMDAIRQAGDWYRQTFPDALVYTNIFPYIAEETGPEKYYGAPLPPGGYDYGDYVYDIIEITQTDVLMYDRYPFFKDGTTSDLYFANMEAIRAIALETGLPYWAWIQSFERGDYVSGYREPSGSDLNMQVCSHLTSGYTGISYFTYNNLIAPAIINNDNTTNPLYDRAQSINVHVKNIGKVLKYLTSTGVRYVASPNNPLPAGTTAWTQNAGNDPHIVNITVSVPGTDNNALIGFFTDDSGEKYFMFTNLKHGQDLSPADCTLEFSITFDSTINELLTLNSVTGEQELMTLNNHTLNLTLDGGMGKMFKYNTGNRFVGIPLPGDANIDGAVDVGDLGILAANYGQSGKTWSQGDFNDDGKVDVGDLGILASNYGTSASNANWDADYVKAFGEAAEEDDNTDSSSICGFFGVPLIVGLVLMGLMLVKL